MLQYGTNKILFFTTLHIPTRWCAPLIHTCTHVRHSIPDTRYLHDQTITQKHAYLLRLYRRYDDDDDDDDGGDGDGNDNCNDSWMARCMSLSPTHPHPHRPLPRLLFFLIGSGAAVTGAAATCAGRTACNTCCSSMHMGQNHSIESSSSGRAWVAKHLSW